MYLIIGKLLFESGWTTICDQRSLALSHFNLW